MSAKNYPPTTPTARTVVPREHAVTVTGVIFNVAPDSNPNEKARLVVSLSRNKYMTPARVTASDYVKNSARATVEITGLDAGTTYYLRISSQDEAGLVSNSQASETFKTKGTAPVAPAGGKKVNQHAPSPPTDVQINTVDAEDAQITRSTGSVTISAMVDDPDQNEDDENTLAQKVRLVVQYAPNADFSSGVRTEISPLVAQESRATVHLNGLAQETLYHCRLYTRDSLNLLSQNWTGASFWTNRAPIEPEQFTPPDNADISKSTPVTFSWDHQDPDEDSVQGAFHVRWRVASTPNSGPGAWVDVSATTTDQSVVIPANTFSANTYYEWQVRTMDPQGSWGPFAYPFSFFCTGTSLAPLLTAPMKGEARDVTEQVRFSWTFRDPDQGDSQVRADIRYRVVGTEDWTLVPGDTTTPGNHQWWDFPEETFAAGQNYEWQVRTLDALSSATSDWSEAGNFWTIRTPGLGAPGGEVGLPDFSEPQSSLGCGSHRVFVYERGGTRMIGEITPLATLTYDRKRDDISHALMVTNGFGDDCCLLLSELRSWIHELVIFRDGVRVWEGPISRITYAPDSVEIEAKDVMNYVYRRIMRQGYNDSYRIQNGVQVGLLTVVQRAERIILNALAPYDPNVLPYLTSLKFPDDTRQSRVVPDMSRTAWEEVDDLAATAGLDYTTVGRRIMLWDTHRYIGKLPEMRDENFSSPPVVTEYGMALATDFGVTNNNGISGLARRDRGAYGPIEQLASAYGEKEGAVAEAVTGAARSELESTFASQAERNIAGRWPTPLVVRVPDNSTLNPDTNVGINQLVPGVWIPLRARGTCRTVTQWQKLDLVTVTEDEAGEKISVTMSPAPNGGLDPDAEQAALED